MIQGDAVYFVPTLFHYMYYPRSPMTGASPYMQSNYVEYFPKVRGGHIPLSTKVSGTSIMIILTSTWLPALFNLKVTRSNAEAIYVYYYQIAWKLLRNSSGLPLIGLLTRLFMTKRQAYYCELEASLFIHQPMECLTLSKIYCYHPGEWL